ncbi:MAG TPA: LuxR C-terminal-related transcriptional regulator [Chloroflexia bacterium]|jgi:DNA-binding CsgD family transcriptional regulator
MSIHANVPDSYVAPLASNLAPTVTSLLLGDYNPGSSTRLIVDSPQGTAIHTLESLANDKSKKPLATAVITFNLCVEHWEDLWDMHPDILLVAPKSDADIAIALAHGAGGRAYKATPGGQSTLNLTERKVLRYVAQGWCNRRIAAHLNLQEKTVMNTLTQVYNKLNLGSRTQAVLYYWGLWDLLKPGGPLPDMPIFVAPPEIVHTVDIALYTTHLDD